MKLKIIGGLFILFILAQLIPFGHDHDNPVVVKEPAWDTLQTRETFMRVCGDCHSHHTKWPWYSNVAPVSWLVQHDVEEGRAHFNVSMWGIQKKNEGHEAAEEVEEGDMPMWIYAALHSKARLDEADKESLIKGLKATFGSDSDKDMSMEHDEDEAESKDDDSD